MRCQRTMDDTACSKRDAMSSLPGKSSFGPKGNSARRFGRINARFTAHILVSDTFFWTSGNSCQTLRNQQLSLGASRGSLASVRRTRAAWEHRVLATLGTLTVQMKEFAMSLRRGKIGLAVVLGCLALVWLVSVVPAQQAKSGEPAGEDQEVVKSKATRTPAASTINFRKELKLPFDSLTTLGSRIDAARRKPDPVALAHLANELAVDEKVSGKQASLTSKMLAKEAAELAGLRKQEHELNAVLQVNQQMMMEEDNITSIKKDIARAQEQVKQDKEAINQNLEPTWKPRKVVVNNYTTQYPDIYVNGNYKTQVQPGMQQTIVIEHRWNPTILKAYGNEDNDTFGPRYIWGRFEKYTWNIE
jgi:hypothetical protein